MKRFIILLALTAFVGCPAAPAFARGGGHGGGGGGSSHSSRSSSHARNSSSKYIIAKCKTAKCYAKHPNGRVAIPKGKKRH